MILTLSALLCLFCIGICGKVGVTSTTDPYGSLFVASGYPMLGDIPMLNRKIFRGTRVTIREHPYIASIRRNYVHYLTACLLTKNLLLTVAHPLYRVPISELSVVVGENYSDRGTNLLTVVLMLFHKQFNPYTLNADIVLIRIYEDLVIRSSSKPIALVSPTTALIGRAFVTGWGRCDFTGKELCLPRSSIYSTDEWIDPMLRTISFEITPRNSCNVYRQHNNPIRPGMLCVGEARDSEVLSPCLAVPGAALVLRGTLAGLLSWGLGCGYRHDLPLVYTDIQYYITWIIDNAAILKNITQNDIKDLFMATKAAKLTEWIIKTRVNKPLITQETNYKLHALDIDINLSKLEGKMYDIRDSIYEGSLHSEKKKNFKELKEKHKIIKFFNWTQNITVKPFLHKSRININDDEDENIDSE